MQVSIMNSSLHSLYLLNLVYEVKDNKKRYLRILVGSKWIKFYWRENKGGKVIWKVFVSGEIKRGVRVAPIPNLFFYLKE